MALRHCLLQKMFDEKIFFQRRNEHFDPTEIADSIWTWDKIHVT